MEIIFFSLQFKVIGNLQVKFSDMWLSERIELAKSDMAKNAFTHNFCISNVVSQCMYCMISVLSSLVVIDVLKKLDEFRLDSIQRLLLDVLLRSCSRVWERPSLNRVSLGDQSRMRRPPSRPRTASELQFCAGNLIREVQLGNRKREKRNFFHKTTTTASIKKVKSRVLLFCAEIFLLVV